MINLGINAVAFYPGLGGPESFNGLSDMIFQLADMISCAQDYGLGIKSFLDTALSKPSSLKRLRFRAGRFSNTATSPIRVR